ncbi:AMP-binding protein, partial [Dolichospermum sp. ST_sed1]|nr:AMP-binding protein [Dolichospermum sp. ST_sed1]
LLQKVKLNPKIAFVFPGHGTQNSKIGISLYQSNDVFRSYVDRIIGFFEREDEEISNFLKAYFLDSLDVNTKTNYVQPIMLTVSVALANLAESYGIKPTVFFGHSFGEIPAALCAGVLDLEQAVYLVCQRTLVFNQNRVGSMISIISTQKSSIVEKLLNEFNLEIAVINSDSNIVLSGREIDINLATKYLEQEKINYRCIDTPHAFHSSFIENISIKFESLIQNVYHKKAKGILISNSTGKVFDATIPASKYWKNHMRHPVQFAQCIETSEKLKCDVIVEVGPSSIISFCRGDVKTAFLPQKHSLEMEFEYFLESLCLLWSNGCDVDLDKHLYKANPILSDIPAYQFDSTQGFWLNTNSNESNQPEVIKFEENDQPFEEKIKKIWEAVLNQKIDNEDDFFRLGGHSLLASRIIDKCQRELKVNLSFSDLLANSTLEQFTKNIMGQDLNSSESYKCEFEKILQKQNITKNEQIPTPLQSAYILGRGEEQILGGIDSFAYFEFEIKNKDVKKVKLAIEEIHQKHDMLRSCVNENGLILNQLISIVPVIIHTGDYSKNDLEAIRTDILNCPLEITQSLYKVHLVSTISGIRILVKMDYTLADARSLTIYHTQLTDIVEKNLEIKVNSKGSFFKYLEALELVKDSKSYKNAMSFWENTIKSIYPTPILPLCKDLNKCNSKLLKRRYFIVNKEDWNEKKLMAKKLSVTPTALVLASFSRTLERFGERSDFTLNLTIYNRPEWDNSYDETIGDFTSTLLLPIDCNKIREEGITYVQNELFKYLQHKAVCGVEVLRMMQRAKQNEIVLAPYVFTSLLTENSEKVLGNSTKYRRLLHLESHAPQILIDCQVAEQSDGSCIVWWDCRDEMFYSGFIEQAMDFMKNDMSGADKKNSFEVLVDKVNMTEKDFKLQNLYSLFEQSVLFHSDQTAIFDGDEEITFQQLNQKVNEISEYLFEKGIVSGDRIGVYMEKSWYQIAAVLGILRSGGTYVPFDLKWPELRIKGIGEKCQIRYLACDFDSQFFYGFESFDVKSLGLKSNFRPPRLSNLDDAAYIIFTSGSTGEPKGVQVSHRGAANTIIDINEMFQIKKSDRVFYLSSLCFDLSVYDIF